jgi:hypothetical protein
MLRGVHREHAGRGGSREDDSRARLDGDLDVKPIPAAETRPDRDELNELSTVGEWEWAHERHGSAHVRVDEDGPSSARGERQRRAADPR